jgi:hypothetical protein
VTIGGDYEAHTIHLEGEKVEAAPEHALGEGVEGPLELVIFLRVRQYDHRARHQGHEGEELQDQHSQRDLIILDTIPILQEQDDQD